MWQGVVRFCTVCTILSESLQVFQTLVNRSLLTIQLFSLSLFLFDNSLRCFSQEAGVAQLAFNTAQLLVDSSQLFVQAGIFLLDINQACRGR